MHRDIAPLSPFSSANALLGVITLGQLHLLCLVLENEYGMKELRLFEPGLEPDTYGDVGFWISPFSLVYRERGLEGEKSHGIIWRLWEKLRLICSPRHSRTG
jgi:hypothetical protein